jgi:tRNA (cytidine/uridine-2'-O-)-methyltransferase
MFNIVLFEPEIPPNTGNIIRLASNSGCNLHLIEPLGFTLDEKNLRRAGLDYHQYSTVVVHASWNAFMDACRPERLLAISTKGKRSYSDVSFNADDYFVFGPETRGLPAELMASPTFCDVLRLPMMEHSRSLNLANTVAVVVYEAWRQLNFAGAGEAARQTLGTSD